jgi:hypothetical protein
LWFCIFNTSALITNYSKIISVKPVRPIDGT